METAVRLCAGPLWGIRLAVNCRLVTPVSWVQLPYAPLSCSQLRVTSTFLIVQNYFNVFQFASQIYSDIFYTLNAFLNLFRDIVQLVSMRGLGPRGRGFESRYPDLLGIFDMVSRLHCSLSIFFFARRLSF